MTTSISLRRRQWLAAAGALAPPALPVQASAQFASSASWPQRPVIAQAVKTKALTERMAALGTEAVDSTPQEVDAVIGSEIEKWSRIIRVSHIKID